MIDIIFLKPYLSNKIWGGNKLSEYGYKLDSNSVGEALIISALDNMSSIVTNDEFKGLTLKTLFENNKELFNNYNKPYPLLTKIIDANDNLSVQVHPDDAYALKKENCYGKTECWYILDAEPNAKIVYGVKTNNKQATEKLIRESKWDELLNYIEVKKGDFIFVPAGKVHAIGKGILIYELQQSSDITYRLYDYDRLENNKPRQLHIVDSINCIKYDDYEIKQGGETLIDCDYFNLKHIIVTSSYEIYDKNVNWFEVTVINGRAEANGKEIKKGDAFIITHGSKVIINGEVEFMISYAK